MKGWRRTPGSNERTPKAMTEPVVYIPRHLRATIRSESVSIGGPYGCLATAIRSASSAGQRYTSPPGRKPTTRGLTPHLRPSEGDSMAIRTFSRGSLASRPLSVHNAHAPLRLVWMQTPGGAACTFGDDGFALLYGAGLYRSFTTPGLRFY